VRVASALIAVVLVGAGCGSGDEGAAPPRGSVKTVPVEHGPVPEHVEAAGAALLGVVSKQGVLHPDDHVVVSTDDGRNWQRVTLPGVDARAPIAIGGPFELDGLVAFTARRFSIFDGGPPDTPFANGPVWVWTTADGRAWHGTQLQSDGPPIELPSVHRDGDTLLLGFNERETMYVYASRDDGSSWQRTPVTGLRLDPDQPPIPESAALQDLWREGDQLVGTVTGASGIYPSPLLVSRDNGATWALQRCPRRYCGAAIVAGTLLVRTGEERQMVSTDGGRHWAAIAKLHGRRVYVQDAVELRDGGWLAVGISALPTSDSHTAELLRSADGRSWERVVGGVCEQGADDETQSGFAGLSPFGDGWLAPYLCAGHIPLTSTTLGGPRFADEFVSDVYAISADGRAHAVVAGSHQRGRFFGEPVAARDRVLVPLVERGETVAFEVLTPTTS
jgi:photosystem II stability/assembly factor-like uncharacterized protein